MNKIVIIGKKNVGKSSLFNLLTKKQQSTIINYHGYTRDCIAEKIKIKSKIFEIIDTAGIGHEKTELDYKTIKKTWEYIKLSNIIIFLINAEDKIDSININILNIIKKINKHIIYVINKIDLVKETQIELIKKELKIKSPILISIKTTIGLSLLLENIHNIKNYMQPYSTNYKNITNIAIVGRPNVGKSSLVNKISNTESLITDNTPGTTRDSIKIETNIKNIKYNIIDTPGIKKQMNIASKVEKISTKSALNTIKTCDIAILTIDLNNLITSQDQSIITYINNNKKNALIVINKSDMQKKINIININDKMKNAIKNIDYVFVSSKYNFGIENALSHINNIQTSQKKIINYDIVKKTEKILYKYNVNKIIINKYMPIIINVEIKRNTLTNSYKKKYISGTIIKLLKLQNISTKIIFK